MNALEVALLASGLAVDSCMVALARGLSTPDHRTGEAWVMGLVFGVFQGGMALAGWFAGEPIARLAGAIGHWIAFATLTAIGLRTIRAGYAPLAEPHGALTPMQLLVAACATSIDALAAGFGLKLADASIAPTAISTAAITCIGSVAAYFAARRVGLRWERAGHWIAGLILIGIGARILLAHLA